MKRIYEIQSSLKAIKKDAENTHFHNKYFDINTLIGVLKPLLLKQKLMVLQPVSHIEGKPALKTIIYDSEGKTVIEDITPLPDNIEPHKMGSAITYFRRYCLVSLLFLEAEDDDGNATIKPQAQQVQAQQPQVDLGKCIYCGAVNYQSKTTGNAYCSKKCWLQPSAPTQSAPTPEYTGEPVYEDLPFS